MYKEILKQEQFLVKSKQISILQPLSIKSSYFCSHFQKHLLEHLIPYVLHDLVFTDTSLNISSPYKPA